MDKKEIREKLKNSLDMVEATMVLFCCGLIVALEGLFVLIFLPRSEEDPSRWLVFWVMALVSALPFLIYCLWRRVQIFRRPESYYFCKATLSNPISGRIRHTIRFTVVIEDPEGYKFAANTHSIFSAGRGFGSLSLEDYINKTVTVGYNEETGQVVVIG